MDLSLSLRTVNGTIDEPAYELMVGATPGRARLMELGITLAEATASIFGLGRPQAKGIAPAAAEDFLLMDPSDVLAAGVVQADTAWDTDPTVPLQFFRRITLPATIGTGIIWTFGDGLIIPVDESLVVWNLANNALADIYAVIRF